MEQKCTKRKQCQLQPIPRVQHKNDKPQSPGPSCLNTSRLTSNSLSLEAPKKNRHKHNINIHRQEEISQATALLISSCGLPISFVETQGFRHFMSVVEPTYEVPVASTILTRLKLLYSQIRIKLHDAIGTATHVALTSDGWSSRAQDSYVTATIHFIDDDWKLKNFELCAEYMEDKSTADNLAIFFEQVILEWELQGKVHAVLTDNAANMLAAVRLVSEFENNLTCAAHTIQICVKKGLEAVEAYKIVLKKASSITSHFHHSNNAASALSLKQQQLGLKALKLLQSCPTRWNSSFFMCERLIANRSAVLAVLADREVTPLNLAIKLETSERQWAHIEQLLRLLKPFQIATEVLCSEDVTISNIRPIVFGLITKHLRPNIDDDEHVANFMVTANEALMARFRIDRDELDDVLPEQVSSFLDPRYKNLEMEKDTTKEVIRNFIKIQI